MNNTLHKQLKVSFDGFTLPVLGAIILKVEAQEVSDNLQRYLQIVTTTGDNVTVSVDGSGFFTVGSEQEHKTSLTFTGARGFYFDNTHSYNIKIESKYNVKQINGATPNANKKMMFDIDLNLMSYLPGLTYSNLAFSKIHGDISAFGNSPLVTSLFLRYSYAEGDISELAGCTSLTDLRIDNTNIGGDISGAGTLTNITKFQAYSSNISGSIESFVAAQIAEGRTSVSYSTPIIFDKATTYLTFGGELKKQATYTFLTWDSASKIAVYTGGSGTIESTERVYAKGATAEEIAAWEAAGKTVYVVD